jgi:gluconate 2-dehydrogenase gamma chain
MEDNSRRQFLFRSATGLGTAWVLANWPGILAAYGHAHAAAGDSALPALEFFSPEQAAEVEAIAAQVIPTDDAPGAREARVLYFIDRALTTFDRENQSAYVEGLQDLRAKVGAMFPGKESFAQLSSDQQIQLLTTIETTDFFEQVRVHTIMGFFCDPSHGGNFEEAGWKLIGFKNLPFNQQPFGHYDAEAAKEAAKEK